MEKYVCVKNYLSLNGNINFTKNDIIEAEHAPSQRISNRYVIKRDNGFFYLMKEEQFLKIFKKQFTFGR